MKEDMLWKLIGARLKEDIPLDDYNTWFAPLSAKTTECEIVLSVPNRFYSEWIADKYWPYLSRACDEVTGKKLTVVFNELNQNTGSVKRPRVNTQQTKFKDFNSRYAFSSFVVGPCNELAYAACQAAANNPGKLYNPLFIFGEAGLGKTHLLNAVGNHISEYWPNMRIRYNSLEGFTNELIHAVRYEGINRFQEKYRKVDCLLLDDIQLLAGRDRTQEELFHTFNALYDSGKQIIVTSDKMPREIPSLERRLRTRFEWGLLADLQPPDDETKVAILQEKASSMGLDLPKKAAFFLARQSESNIRVLEGYLKRALAMSQLKGQEVTLDLVKSVVSPLLGANNVSPEDVLKVVSAHFDMKIADIKSNRKTRDITLPRQIAMYLIRKLTRTSYPEIGRLLGGKDHSTVVKGVKKLDEIIKSDKNAAEQVRLVEKTLLGKNTI